MHFLGLLTNVENVGNDMSLHWLPVMIFKVSRDTGCVRIVCSFVLLFAVEPVNKRTNDGHLPIYYLFYMHKFLVIALPCDPLNDCCWQLAGISFPFSLPPSHTHHAKTNFFFFKFKRLCISGRVNLNVFEVFQVIMLKMCLHVLQIPLFRQYYF